jgi:rhomboid protease GluP
MTRRQSILCPSCRRLIHVSEPTCPYCETPRPGLWGLTPILQRLFGQRLDLVLLTSSVCGLLYALSCGIDLQGVSFSSDIMRFGSPSDRALYLFGMSGGWAWQAGHFWTLLTAIYLHGSLLHVIFNLLFLRWLGPTAEEVFGPARFFLLFTASGVCGYLLSNWFSGAPTLGASGGVFGLLGALAAFGRRRGGTVGNDISKQMWALALGMGLFGYFYGGVNNWAHGGGFLAGLIAGSRLPLQARKAEGRTAMIAALVVLGLTVCAFLVSIAAWGPTFVASLR